MNIRYVVVLSGKEAIHEALIKRSADFSDKIEVYTNNVNLNVRTKGKVPKCSVYLCIGIELQLLICIVATDATYT